MTIETQGDQPAASPPPMQDADSRDRWWLFLIVSLGIALAVRWALLAWQSIPFNSDEAILGLMARHITEGARPIFFYGQAYMGSLDAWLIAGSFHLFGDSVTAIRLVQIVLYLAFLAITMVLATRMYGPSIGRWTAPLAALPPVLIMTYSSATLGGYGELLVLGGLTLLLGYETVRKEHGVAPIVWPLLGLSAGFAFWTLGVALVYLAPVALIHVLRFNPRRMAGYASALVGFALGSLPWWIYNLGHDWAALDVLISQAPIESVWWERLFGFIVLGVPALLGLRYPWTPEFMPTVWLFIGITLHAGVFLFLFRRWRQEGWSRHPGTQLMIGIVIFFVVGFVGTHFGVDSTGRYLLPLYTPLLIGGAYTLESVWRRRRASAVALLIGFMVLNGAGVWRAAASPTGLTTQFDAITRFGNEHDEELIEFLRQEGVSAGYSNYWVTYRVAFTTNEEIILAPLLPYKPDLRYSPSDQRIDRYLELVRSSEEVVYVTSLHPILDEILQRELTNAGVTFRERHIGPYHIYYDLSRPIDPEALDLQPPS